MAVIQLRQGSPAPMLETYKAEPRNTAYLMERACVAAHDAETWEPGLARLRARDAASLVRLAKEGGA